MSTGGNPPSRKLVPTYAEVVSGGESDKGEEQEVDEPAEDEEVATPPPQPSRKPQKKYV